MLKIYEYNPSLKSFGNDIELRLRLYRETKARLVSDSSKGLSSIANAYMYFGIHHAYGCWVYREWAPGADRLFLTGDFNNWDPHSHELTKHEDGTFDITLPGDDALWEGCRVLTVVQNGEEETWHVPLYARRVVQDPEDFSWKCEVIDTGKQFAWTDEGFTPSEPLLIYETHVGMSGEEPRISTYREFADNVLPRVKKAGYNTIQLMAILQHPFYGSFGYQVSNFFAVSSWFGTPDDFKYLVNKAHAMGIRVLLDLVHSHAAKNTAEGINMFDGTDYQFFHKGKAGDHPNWDTKLFNYGKDEVIFFLLSNLKYWLDEYHVDGFRFDGVTSMLYHDHGIGSAFDSDSKYFSLNTDTEAITYLQLANELIREVKPTAITIAEDMSGMPGMCLPIFEGGIGFDYRLAMGLPDMWLQLLRDGRPDDDWNMDQIWSSLCLRRPGEKTVAYAESHDQALVGDKTLMFRLADAAMYTDMDKITHNITIDRAVALHKMIRLLTFAAGGDAYLNFMGNEFGHPEWIDFPREGNGWSYHYCRRQWSLADNGFLKYEWLNDFDREMIKLASERGLFDQVMPHLDKVHVKDHTLAFERGGMLFVFNFHPTEAFKDYPIPVTQPMDYMPILSTDEPRFGGFDQIKFMHYSAQSKYDEGNELTMYLPPRTAVVLVPVQPEPEEQASEEAPDSAPAEKRPVKKVPARKSNGSRKKKQL